MQQNNGFSDPNNNNFFAQQQNVYGIQQQQRMNNQQGGVAPFFQGQGGPQQGVPMQQGHQFPPQFHPQQHQNPHQLPRQDSSNIPIDIDTPSSPSNDHLAPESVNLEFINQSNMGAVESAADFFNNMRLGDDPFNGPAYTSSISAFSPQIWGEKMDALRASSTQHAQTLTTKQRWEQEAIDMHNNAWRFVNEQRKAYGVCGCGNNVSYSYLYILI